jgi:hypothetical protein
MDKDSVICSDGFRTYGVLARKLNMVHKSINLTKGIRVIEKYHIFRMLTLITGDYMVGWVVPRRSDEISRPLPKLVSFL